jgi:hypothetical protein
MMRLTWKDGAATVLTAGVAALYVAFLAGAQLPLVSGPRVLAGVALVAGLGACAIGGSGGGPLTVRRGGLPTPAGFSAVRRSWPPWSR